MDVLGRPAGVTGVDGAELIQWWSAVPYVTTKR